MYYTFYRRNNKGADQTAHMRSLINAFAIRMQQQNSFSRRGSFVLYDWQCSRQLSTCPCSMLSVLSCTRITLYKHII